jgi:pimeloyl-ACP methyl ester carboxylesterase
MPFFTINSKRLHYTDSKPDGDAPITASSTGKTLVFIHGLGSTQNYFFPIIPTLTAAGYRCVTFDNYGAGRSKLDFQQQEHSLETIGQDVLALMDALEVPKAVLVGYSMGGMVPTRVAAMDGKAEGEKRVEGAVCIGPVHPTEGAAEVFRKRIPAVRDGE